MSSMWDVSVINRGKDWVDLEVVLAHPDAGGFPEDPVFALCLLTHEAYGFDDNYQYIPISPLGEAIPHDSSYQPFDLAPVVHEYIKSTVVYEAVRVPFDEDKAHAMMDEKVLAMGISKDSDEWEDAWHDHWREYWDDKNNLPLAKYRIHVTDPKWIEHMKLGASFDTASYSEDGPWIEEDVNVGIAWPADAEGRMPVPGFNDSEIPPRENGMDAELIRGMAESNEPLTAEEIQELLAEHKAFLDSGGRDGEFTMLDVAGMPLNIYSSGADAGKQFELRMKHLAPGTDLSGAELSHCDLSGILAEGVNFSGAKLDGSILTYAFFKGANFDGASLKGTDFTGSDLTGASFKNTDMASTDFEISNCEGADFTGAKLSGATFKGANLAAVKN